MFSFGIALVPIMVGIGVAIDYSRANNFRTAMQAALDAALLAGARDNTANWAQVALNTFNGNLPSRFGAPPTPTFTLDTNLMIYSGRVTGSQPTSMLGIAGINSMSLTVKAAATASDSDDSCILTLDHGQPKSHVSLSLNGIPIVNLSGCSIRSNTALDCNGHDGNATKAIAAGLASGCARPKSYSPPVPDIYAALATNITKKCGTLRPGVSWKPGSLPTGAGFITVNNGGYTVHHVCGDLDLSGSGFLTRNAPSSDTLIIIENGSLNIANNASISAVRTTIVMTGNNTFASRVNFPTGNGMSASLSLSPSIDAANPWQGVALYQDPSLTKNVDNRWGPGATFNADGLVYLPYSNVTTDGNTASNNAKCSKFVMNSFTTNGRVDLNFNQSVAACAKIGLKQWTGVTVHLVQ